MHKIFVCALAVVFLSCHSEEKKDAEKQESKTESTAPLPYTATYSSKFEIGDRKNAETVLAAWKAFDDGVLSTAKGLFADTVTLILRDGTRMSGPRDSIIAGSQVYRDMYSSVKSTVHAFVPLKSTDKDENWLCVWGVETSTSKQGKTDSVGLQETWRLNKDGKINLLYQFGRSLVPPPMSK